MRRPILVTCIAAATITLAAPVWAQTPAPENPFPTTVIKGVFVSGDTVTIHGAKTNFFAQGETVVFRMWARDVKTGKALAGGDLIYAYVAIPNQPNVKLVYQVPTAVNTNPKRLFTASWTIPATYPLGVVPFKIKVKTRSKQLGSFEQLPVATAQLTVTKP